MASQRRTCSCKSMATFFVGILILSMLFTVIPWVQPNGGLWMDISWANFPLYDSEEVEGIEGEINIVRDLWGIPHIFTANTSDLYFACGYVHAQDRLFQMDLYRRLTQGRLAEILGSEYLELDRFYRTLGLHKTANETYAQLSYEVQTTLQSYVAGVNAYLEHIGIRIPMEIRVLGYIIDPWTVEDTLSIERFFAWLFSGGNTFHELRMARLIDAFGAETVFSELFPGTHYNDIPIPPTRNLPQPTDESHLPQTLLNAAQSLATRYQQINTLSPIPVSIEGGSNCWVVNGSRTSTGAPFLCSDLHQSLSLPPLWYEIHFIGTEINAQGITFPGFPFIFYGHNAYIAWGFSGMKSDVSDFYYYTWNPTNPNQYWLDGDWQDITEEQIELQTLIDESLVPVQVTFNYTKHGPIFEESGDRFALKWTGHNASKSAESFYWIAQAMNYSSFCDALRLLEVPNLNFVYADTTGNIAYHATGAHPIRPLGDGPSILNGSSGTHNWLGFIPFDELPQSLNPPTGFLVAANNRPVNSSYPYYLGYNFDPAHRAQRITQLINSSTSHSIETMKGIQLDALSLNVVALKDIIVDVILATDNEALHPGATQLQNWNNEMTTDSIGATIWTTFVPRFVNATFYDEYFVANIIDNPYPAITIIENFTQINYPKWFNNILQSGVQTRDDIIASSFEDTINYLTINLGPDMNAWKYENVHVLWLQHSLLSSYLYLNAPRYPINGAEYTVNYSPGPLVSSGASYRLIVDLAEFDNSLGILPGGQRSNHFSKHYLDQLGLWVIGDYHSLPFPSGLEAMTQYDSILLLSPVPP